MEDLLFLEEPGPLVGTPRRGERTPWSVPHDYIEDVSLRRFRKPLRPRCSGIVGPEPDYEVIYSDIPFKELERFFDVCGYSHMSKVFPRNGKYTSRTGCIHTSGMQLKHIRTWTNFANRVGIEFHSKNGYKFPKGIKKEPIEGSLIKYGPTHTKATPSIKKAKSLVPEGAPLLQKRRISAKSLRRIWLSLGAARPHFSEFVEQFNDKREFLALGTSVKKAPQLVIDAVIKIYSKEEYVTGSLPFLRDRIAPNVRKGSSKEAEKTAKRVRFIERAEAIARRENELRELISGIKALSLSIRVFNQRNAELTRLQREKEDLVLYGPDGPLNPMKDSELTILTSNLH